MYMMYGHKILEKEFNWVSRKTKFVCLFKKYQLFKTYEYWAHTPYLRIGPCSTYEEALSFKLGFDR